MIDILTLETMVNVSDVEYLKAIAQRCREMGTKCSLYVTNTLAERPLVLFQYLDIFDDVTITTWSQPEGVARIVNAHLNGDKDMLLCQDELIDAGFERWARL